MTNSTINNLIIDTPCIGVCSTIYGDTICRGCKRHYQDIIEWNAFDHEKKQTIYQHLSKLMSETVSQFIDIIDASQLEGHLNAQHIRSRPFDDAFCLAHHLLRVSGEKIKCIEDYGIKIKPEFQALSLPELFTLIDETLHDVSVSAC